MADADHGDEGEPEAVGCGRRAGRRTPSIGRTRTIEHERQQHRVGRHHGILMPFGTHGHRHVDGVAFGSASTAPASRRSVTPAATQPSAVPTNTWRRGAGGAAEGRASIRRSLRGFEVEQRFRRRHDVHVGEVGVGRRRRRRPLQRLAVPRIVAARRRLSRERPHRQADEARP